MELPDRLGKTPLPVSQCNHSTPSSSSRTGLNYRSPLLPPKRPVACDYSVIWISRGIGDRTRREGVVVIVANDEYARHTRKVTVIAICCLSCYTSYGMLEYLRVNLALFISFLYIFVVMVYSCASWFSKWFINFVIKLKGKGTKQGMSLQIALSKKIEEKELIQQTLSHEDILNIIQ